MQNDILTRLEAGSKALEDARFNLMSDLSRSIQLQNETLQKQLTSKWSFITGMVTVVALAFVLNFGYELYRINDVMESRKALEVGGKTLADNALRYSDILTDLSSSDSLIAEGHRELLRNAYNDAGVLARDAIAKLRHALVTTGFSETDVDLISGIRHEEPSCLIPAAGQLGLLNKQIQETLKDDQEKRSTDVNKVSIVDLVTALAPRKLRPVVVHSLISATDLQANASFLLGNYDYLRDAGSFIMVLNPSLWSGYHWAGIAANDAKKDNLAIACYIESVKRKPDGNKDNIRAFSGRLESADFDGFPSAWQ